MLFLCFFRSLNVSKIKKKYMHFYDLFDCMQTSRRLSTEMWRGVTENLFRIYIAAHTSTIQYRCFVSPNWNIEFRWSQSQRDLTWTYPITNVKNAIQKSPQINGEMNLQMCIDALHCIYHYRISFQIHEVLCKSKVIVHCIGNL